MALNHRRLSAVRLRTVIGISLLVSSTIGCSRQPYPCVKVSGKITYEDGSLIPTERMRLTFIPQVKPIDPKTKPKLGEAMVDVKTGTFASATTYVPNDGVIPGELRVLITCDRSRSDLIGAEYADPQKSPLKVDTSQSPFTLKVAKPGTKPNGK